MHVHIKWRREEEERWRYGDMGKKVGRLIGIQIGRRIGEMHGVQKGGEVEKKRGAEIGGGEREKATERGG